MTDDREAKQDVNSCRSCARGVCTKHHSPDPAKTAVTIAPITLVNTSSFLATSSEVVNSQRGKNRNQNAWLVDFLNVGLSLETGSYKDRNAWDGERGHHHAGHTNVLVTGVTSRLQRVASHVRGLDGRRGIQLLLTTQHHYSGTRAVRSTCSVAASAALAFSPLFWTNNRVDGARGRT